MAILRAAATASFTLDNTGAPVLITGLTLTPANDTYIAFATIELDHFATGGGDLNSFSIFVGGVEVTASVRGVQEEASLNTSIVTIALSAEVSPTGAQDVEIRHTTEAGGDDLVALKRELTLFPIPAAGTSYEDSDAADDTLATATWTTLDSMTRTPVADDYLLIFTTDAEGPADVDLGFRVSVGGTHLQHTHRQFANNGSLPNTTRPVMIACMVSPNGSQVVEIEWSRVDGAGTITCHQRAMNLIPVATADIVQATGTADDSRTTGDDEILIDDMTIVDPGADDWLVCFSAYDSVGTVGTHPTTYMIHEGGAIVADSDRRNDHDESEDSTNLPVIAGGRVTIAGATDDLEMFWDILPPSIPTWTIHERTLVAIREATAVVFDAEIRARLAMRSAVESQKVVGVASAVRMALRALAQKAAPAPAPGDYLCRRNNAVTTAIPDAGSTLKLDWDTLVANKGDAITMAAGGTFSLNATGHFLVLYSEHIDSADTAQNARNGGNTHLVLAGSAIEEGKCGWYIRNNSTGVHSYITQGMAIINVATTDGNGDELEIHAERSDDLTSADPVRVANERSSVTIIKLDDTADYGIYRSSGTTATSVSDGVRTVINLATTVEEDATFTRTGDSVDIATSERVLCCYSVSTLGGADRSEFQSNVELAGGTVTGSWAQQYVRNTNGADWGASSVLVLLEPTSGNDIDVGVVSREGGGEAYVAALQLMVLPASVETIIVEATTGDFNQLVPNDFVWDTEQQKDAGSFAHTAPEAEIDVLNTGDYLVMSSLANTVFSAVTRGLPSTRIRVQGVDQHTGNTSYNRNSGPAGHATVVGAGLVTGLAVNDSIVIRNNAENLSSAGFIPNDDGAFSVIRLSSIFAAPAFAAAVVARLALRAIAGADKTVANIAAASMALRELADADKTIGSSSRVSLAIRSTVGALKVFVAAALARLALRSTTADDKAADSAVIARLAPRSSTAADKTAGGSSRVSLALRALVDGVAEQVVEAISSVRLAIRSTTDTAKTTTSAALTSMALRASTAGSKTADAIASASLALRTLQDIVRGFNAVSLVRLAMRHASDAAKTSPGSASVSMALRSVISFSTTHGFVALARLALRPSVAGSKTYTGAAQVRLALRTLQDAITVHGFVSVVRFALRSISGHDKTAAGTALDSLALRTASAGTKIGAGITSASLASRASTAAAKTIGAIATASMALRSLVSAAAGDVFNAVSVVSMALRASTDAAKTSASEARARMALRTSTAGSKLIAAISSVSLGLRGTVDAIRAAVVNAVSQISLALRTTTASAKAVASASSVSLAMRTAQAAQKTIAAAASASIALRSTVSGVLAFVVNAAIRASLALSSSSATAFAKLGTTRTAMALRATDGTAKSAVGIALGRIAIRADNNGEKSIAGVAFNRFGTRTTVATFPGIPAKLALVVPLDGVFDLTCALDGIFDPRVALDGEADPLATSTVMVGFTDGFSDGFK